MTTIHKITDLQAQPAVYVGTFAKYNNGSLSGAWLDVAAYNDGAEFSAACLALHADEPDPEIMFQEYQGFPAMGLVAYVGRGQRNFRGLSSRDRR